MNGQRLPRRRGVRGLPAAMVFVVLSGCSGDDAMVYVPGSTFDEELFVVSARGPQVRLGVDEPLVLHAQRRSGPWVPRRASEVEEGACALRSLPPQLEMEVAANVTWHVEPEGHATFNTDLRDDGTREVRFDAPGAYFLTAESSSWCGEPFGGDTLRIEVVE